MSWTLSANGHADNDADEQALARVIGQALSDAGQIVTYAAFNSGSFTGDPRTLAEPQEAETVEPTPEAESAG